MRPRIHVLKLGELQARMEETCTRYGHLRELFEKSKYRYYGVSMEDKIEATATASECCGAIVQRIRIWLDIAYAELEAIECGEGYIVRHKWQLRILAATRAILRCEGAVEELRMTVERTRHLEESVSTVEEALSGRRRLQKKRRRDDHRA